MLLFIQMFKTHINVLETARHRLVAGMFKEHTCNQLNKLIKGHVLIELSYLIIYYFNIIINIVISSHLFFVTHLYGK